MVIDMSGWDDLGIALHRETERIGVEAAALPLVVAKKAETLARARVSTHPRWRSTKQPSASLKNAVRGGRIGPFAADVGYVTGGQGSLGAIAELGLGGRKSPHPAVEPSALLAAVEMEELAVGIIGRIDW